MGTIKKYKWLFIVAIVLSFCTFLFFNIYFRDVKALTDFSKSYIKFDKGISDLSASLIGSDFEGALATDSLEVKVDMAFSELKTNASERISSLIKNDAEFMKIELDILNLSINELDAITAYKSAPKDKKVDVEVITKELRDLKNKDQTPILVFNNLFN